jgi:A/G-specific adenine glycosylase
VAITERHGGRVPSDPDILRTLPGIGQYTAAAVGAFAYGVRSAVVDTNVRRVLARAVAGRAQAAPGLTRAELDMAERVLPSEAGEAARWNAAVMELGALVCTSRSPDCDSCPVAELCAWRRAGCPAYEGPPRRAQTWHGTDRQCRGRLLDRVRQASGPVPAAELAGLWPDAEQRARCLTSLLTDGLLTRDRSGGYSLP